MSTMNEGNRDIMARLGFDLLDHLEAMRGKGIRNIEMEKCTQASSASLRTWEDSNYPYRLPADIRAFLKTSDGFSLSWTAKHHDPEGGGGGSGGRSGRETVIGRIRVDRLSAIKRVPLDADDLRDMAFSRARASAGAGTGAAGAAKTGPLRRPSPPSSSPPSPDGVHQARGRGNDSMAGSGGRAEGQAPAPAYAGASASYVVNDGRGGGGGGGGSGGAYGIAAFSLDSSCEVGRVALVYGGAPTGGDTARRSGVGIGAKSRESEGKGASVAELTTPEVWLQDMSCRWHFLADSFTSYFRMMLVHLGVLGWQQAFSPVGLSPSTEQCMRLYCPDRLLFDQLEWQKERAKARAAKEIANGNSSGHQAGSGPQARRQPTALRRHG